MKPTLLTKTAPKLALAFLMAAVGACSAKKRPDHFPQNEGTDLLRISEYDGVSYPAKTAQPIGSVASSRAKDVKISTKDGELNDLKLVSYSTEAALAKDLPFRGKENSEYQLQYRIGSKFLTIYKVAPKAMIPQQEQTFAETIEGGKLAVPLAGYPITGFFNVDNKKNDNLENTNTLMEIPAKDKSVATYFKIDRNGRTLFKAAEKIDVFPASLFDGEWYYSETIVATSTGKETNIGFNTSTDTDFETASKIKFSKTNKSINGVNVNVDDRIDKTDDINFKPVIEIPVEWVSYKREESGNDKGMKEEADTDKAWNDRPFFKINFQELSTATTRMLDTDVAEAVKGDNRLLDLEITDTYIGMTLGNIKQGIRIKYSFLKASTRDYKPRPYSEADTKTFGYFTTQKAVASNHEIFRKEDLQKLIFLNRFNPKNKEIVFHFSQGTPKDEALRSVGRASIEEWNKIFQNAGTGITVKLDESFDVSLGDLRYNSINLIQSLKEGNLFGFGPSIADPKTGEIISATTNVHVTPIRSAVTDFLRLYIYQKLGVLRQDFKIPIQLPMGSAPSSDALARLIKTVEKVKAPLAQKLAADLKSELPKPSKVKKKEKWSYGAACDSGITAGHLAEQIETECPEISAYISKLKPQVESLKDAEKIADDTESAVLNACTDRIMRAKLQATLVHELGHNFGLRHNFHASNDAKNFYSPAETGTRDEVHSSSTMEYTAFDEDRLVKPGKYDRAAIAFAYADRLVKQDETLSPNIDITKSIADNARALGIEARSYKYCTDEDVFFGYNPMCNRFDAGVTPEEITEHAIQEYWNSVANYNYRLDRLQYVSQARIASYRAANFILPMRRIYDEFRLRLYRLAPATLEYLDGLNSKDFNEVVSKALAKTDPETLSYYKASRRVTDFLKDLVAKPNHYCVVKDANGKTQLVEWSTVRAESYRQNQASIKTCSDAGAAPYFQSMQMTLVTEVGYDVENVKYSHKPEDIDKPDDVIGFGLDRLVAMIGLSLRNPADFTSRSFSYFPNPLDEPGIRETVVNQFLDRVVNGVSFQVTGTESPLYFDRYRAESDLLAGQFGILKNGLIVPGRTDITAARLAPFQVLVARDQDMVKAATAVLRIPGGVTLVTDTDNEIATLLIQKYKNTQARLMPPPTEADVKTLSKFVDALPNKPVTEVTVDDFMKSLMTLMPLVEAHPNLAKLPTVSKILDIMETLRQQLVGEYQAAAQSDLTKKAFMNKKIAPYLTQLKIGYLMLAGSVDMNTFVNEQMILAKSYQEQEFYRRDLEHLGNLILQLLNGSNE